MVSREPLKIKRFKQTVNAPSAIVRSNAAMNKAWGTARRRIY